MGGTMKSYTAHAIEAQQITKRFGGAVAVDALSMRVPHGSMFGLLGPNGAGKTTTIRMILHILMPDSGRILVSGAPNHEGVKDRIGYLPEERGLYLKMSVIDVLVFLAEMKGIPRRRALYRVEEWLERLELEACRHRLVEELSKGMQQKVQFIGAVVHDPDLLILDEPFAGLDPVNLTLVKDIMAALHRQGVTIVLSTHQMEQVERLCDRICLVDHGRTVLAGTLADVKAQFQDRRSVVLDFEGDPGFLDRSDLIQASRVNGRKIELRLQDGISPDAVLPEAMAQGTVWKFEVVAPSLHDIFIEVVRGSEHIEPAMPP